jgi:hypothetical protein
MIEDHKPHNDPLNMSPAAREEEPDAAEVWGKRVGRTLGVAFAIFLVWQLLSTYVFKSV